MDMDVFAPNLIRKTWPDLGLDSLSGSVPKWIDRAGDLVVVGGEVNWSTPESHDGTDEFEVAPGTYPVYAGVDEFREPEDPGRARYHVRVLFIAFATPEKIAESSWHLDGASGLQIDGYACLWSRRAQQCTPHETLLGFRDSVYSAEVLSRRRPWINEVTDRESGANVMVFPVLDSFVSSVELLDADEELLALLYFTWSP
jgi:hypothetical protein